MPDTLPIGKWLNFDFAIQIVGNADEPPVEIGEGEIAVALIKALCEVTGKPSISMLELSVVQQKEVVWTTHRIKKLEAMWRAGDSASTIARSLGGVSRSAVIGKAGRMGLPSRPSPIKRKQS